MQHGEYVSPSKVESELKTCPFVDNICVYADSTKQFVVALITPNTEQLTAMALKQQSMLDPHPLLLLHSILILIIFFNVRFIFD